MKKASGQKIIYCDSRDKNQTIFGAELKRFDPGIKVSRTSSCEELLYMLYKHKISPFLIFMNTELQGKDNIACLKEIKSNDRFRYLPVIMVGPNNMGLIKDSYENGAAFYLIKPSDEKDCQNIFKKIFSRNGNVDLEKRNKEKFVIQGG